MSRLSIDIICRQHSLNYITPTFFHPFIFCNSNQFEIEYKKIIINFQYINEKYFGRYIHAYYLSIKIDTLMRNLTKY